MCEGYGGRLLQVPKQIRLSARVVEYLHSRCSKTVMFDAQRRQSVLWFADLVSDVHVESMMVPTSLRRCGLQS